MEPTKTIMATFRAVTLTGGRHLKTDGTTNIKIRITHDREVQYISTDLYIKPENWRDGAATDPWVNSRILDYLAHIQTDISAWAPWPPMTP